MMRALASLTLLFFLSGCMTIGAFNRFTPQDAGVERVAHDAAYGEGSRHTLDIYAPEAGARNAPVIVFFYGGGWRTGAKADYRFIGRAFAAQGFLTVVPDYRVYPDARFPDFLTDSAAALRWVQDHARDYGGDPRRIVLVGHSAGAYNAVMLALNGEYLNAAGVNARHLRGVVGLAGPYVFPVDHPQLRDVFGGAPDPELTQPVHFARTDAPPLLLLTGDLDRRVPPRSVYALRDAMRQAGGTADARVYPGLSHGGVMQALALSRRDQSPVFRDVVAFARRVTGAAYVSAPALERTH